LNLSPIFKVDRDKTKDIESLKGNPFIIELSSTLYIGPKEGLSTE